jgi:hypothetical protein
MEINDNKNRTKSLSCDGSKNMVDSIKGIQSRWQKGML